MLLLLPPAPRQAGRDCSALCVLFLYSLLCTLLSRRGQSTWRLLFWFSRVILTGTIPRTFCTKWRTPTKTYQVPLYGDGKLSYQSLSRKIGDMHGDFIFTQQPDCSTLHCSAFQGGVNKTTTAAGACGQLEPPWADFNASMAAGPMIPAGSATEGDGRLAPLNSLVSVSYFVRTAVGCPFTPRMILVVYTSVDYRYIPGYVSSVLQRSAHPSCLVARLGLLEFLCCGLELLAALCLVPPGLVSRCTISSTSP